MFGTWVEKLECAQSKKEEVIDLNGLVDFIWHSFEQRLSSMYVLGIMHHAWKPLEVFSLIDGFIVVS